MVNLLRVELSPAILHARECVKQGSGLAVGAPSQLGSFMAPATLWRHTRSSSPPNVAPYPALGNDLNDTKRGRDYHSGAVESGRDLAGGSRSPGTEKLGLRGTNQVPVKHPTPDAPGG
jgi:hypothetical protein